LYTSTSPCSLLWPSANKKQARVRLVGTCPAHIVTFSLRYQSHRHWSQTSYRGFNPLGLKTGGNLDVIGAFVNLNAGIGTPVVTHPVDKAC
jgi:hypothetical protein